MYLIFDTETTGKPRNYRAPVSDLSNWPRMVRLAWRQYDEQEQEISKGDYIIKPQGYFIPEDVVRIHGISNKRAYEEGVDLNKVLVEFSDLIDQSEFIIAHNMNFDKNIVGAEFLRVGVQNNLFEKPNICTMELSTNYCKIPGPYGYKWPRLQELHFELFNKEFEEAHNATIDVVACAECFFELKNRGVI